MKILLMNGAPGCGKDTAAQMLGKIYWDSILHEKFAMPLRKAMCGFYGWTDQQLETHKRTDPTVRKMMIGLSQDVAKKVYAPDYFGAACALRIREAQETCPKIDKVVISDAGFQPEVDAFVETLADLGIGMENLQMWNILRRGHDFAGDSREPTHLEDGNTIHIINDLGIDRFKAAVQVYGEAFFDNAW